MKTKSEIDGQHPASNYLVVTDPDDTSTWHLWVRNTFGLLDHKLMGDAWAALHEGFRGRKYEGPNKTEAIKKLTELYYQANMRLPGVKNRGSNGSVTIFNRAEADANWIHIVPAGELPNAEAGITQVLDDRAMVSIIANIEKERNAQGDSWPGIYAGKEHFIYDPNQDSAALAWFKDFQLRDDGIWASRDGLTPEGRNALAGQKYKFTSFVADRGDLEHLGGDRHRVKRIETVGFTNMANGKHLLKPIMNRGDIPLLPHQLVSIADPLTPEQRDARENAFQQWWECMKSKASCTRRKGFRMTLQWLWDHCKAEYPHVYEAAFGNIQGNTETAGTAEMSKLTNRIQTFSGMDFRFSWNFVRENLPQVFNRRMAAQKTPSKVNPDNYAGVQKLAEKYFSELVGQEQALYGIGFAQAFSRVANRELVLRKLANYEMAPQEAFAHAPELQVKLLNREQPSNPGEVPLRAKRLFEQLVNDEMRGGKSHLRAHSVVMNRDRVLCDLVNNKITPAEAFQREPSLRERIEKVYVPR